MNKESLEAIRSIMREELQSMHTRLDLIEHRLGDLEARQDKSEVSMVNLKASLKNGLRQI